MTEKILIYGATGGIGSETARLLRGRGYDLHLVGRHSQKLAELAEKLGASQTVGDVADDELFARVAAGLVDQPLAGVVYAVGTLNLRSVARLTPTELRNDLHVNAIGAALAVQAALPALRLSPRSSSVVLFSSIAASQGFSMHASMGMAKGAVNGLVLSLAAELAPRIRINAIAPSLTQTPLAEKIVVNERLAVSIAKQHPLQRLGTPADIAALTAFLLSADADWITGQIIGVDGGRSTLQAQG